LSIDKLLSPACPVGLKLKVMMFPSPEIPEAAITPISNLPTQKDKSQPGVASESTPLYPLKFQSLGIRKLMFLFESVQKLFKS
jgi:hypothetical protein